MNKKHLITLSTLGVIASMSNAFGSDRIYEIAAEYEEKYYGKVDREERRKLRQLELRQSEKEYNKSPSLPTSPSLNPTSPPKVTSPLQKPAAANEQPNTMQSLPRVEDQQHVESTTSTATAAPNN
jgi:hypothetical protein